MKVFTGEQMAEIDRRTIEGGKPGIELMRAAGKAVFELITEIYSDLSGKRAVIVAGKGNNGGDGFRIAELLKKNGIHTRAFLVGKKNEIRSDALTCMTDAEKTGLKIIEIQNREDIVPFIESLESADIIVDALFGTGLRGDITDLPGMIVDIMNSSSAEVVAVDIPSGVNSNTGMISESTVMADYTVTFGFMKSGLVIKPGTVLLRKHPGCGYWIPGGNIRCNRTLCPYPFIIGGCRQYPPASL